jgi:hypothetical protein
MEPVAVKETRQDPLSMDAAWTYLNTHDSIAHGEPADLKALRRRVDWHVLPLAFLCYTMQFIDKVLINVSSCSYSWNTTLTLPAVCCSHGPAKGLGAEGQQLLECCHGIFHCLSDCRGA